MGPVTSELGVFLGRGEKSLVHTWAKFKVGDDHGMAAQGTLWDDYNTWAVSRFASIMSQKQLCVDPGARSCWLVTLS